MNNDKQILRQEARRHLAMIPPQDKNHDAAADHFFNSIKPQKNQCIAAYWPMAREFDPRPILERALQGGILCALPIVQKDSKILSFAKWDETMPLMRGPYGILQPEIIDIVLPDIVIVPLLAYDQQGYRLGQGGGYYDATLADLRQRKQIVAVGVAYASQACLFPLPREAHDQKLDWVITPAGARKF